MGWGQGLFRKEEGGDTEWGMARLRSGALRWEWPSSYRKASATRQAFPELGLVALALRFNLEWQRLGGKLEASQRTGNTINKAGRKQ